MGRRRQSMEESSLFSFAKTREVKEPKKVTNKKSPYQNHVENSVKKLVAKEDKPYSKPTTIQINGGGNKYTFNDITEPIDLPITDKTNLRFKVVKSEEEGIYRVDIRTMVLKNNKWIYTERGVNFELGYIEDVIMNLVSLTEEVGMDVNV